MYTLQNEKKISYQLRTSSMQIRNGSKNIGFETKKKKQELIMNFMNEVYYPIELAADFKKKLFLFDFD